MNTTATVCHAGATGELGEETSGFGWVDNQFSLVHQSTRFSFRSLQVFELDPLTPIPLPLIK